MNDKPVHKVARVRGWTKRDIPTTSKTPDPVKPVQHFLVFDCETTADKEQRFLFGSYLYMWRLSDGSFIPIREGLIYADDLPERDPNGYAILQEYRHRGHSLERREFAREFGEDITIPDAEYLGLDLGRKPFVFMLMNGGYPKNEFSSCVDFDAALKGMDGDFVWPEKDLSLVSRTEFVEEILNAVGHDEGMWEPNKCDAATIVGHNLPFDLSRIAVDVAEARAFYKGGFSFKTEPSTHHSIRIRKMGLGSTIDFADGKALIKGWDDDDNELKGKGNSYFTDTLVLGKALTDRNMSLANAGRMYKTDHRKDETEQDFGKITLEHIKYCRDDVRATADLYIAELLDLESHPINLRDSSAYSPASLPKGYLREMGIPKPLEKQPDFPDEIYGYAMSTFYGGRTEAHIRRTPAPVAYMDFTSMYPTVNGLMKLWDFLIHQRIDVREETQAVIDLVESLTIDDLFNKELWPQFRGIVQVEPCDDLFPLRTNYGDSNSTTIGLSRITSDEPIWYSIPDLINAKLNHKMPRVIKAYRFYPDGGQLPSLQSVKLYNRVEVNPSVDDFFVKVIEQKEVARRKHTGNEDKKTCLCEGCKLSLSLKVIANAGSYGIFVEMNRENQNQTDSSVTVFGSLDSSWDMEVPRPEKPGQYCFPPMATLITGASRLMLGMLEKLVTDAGGTWAMCDTDSMAVVTGEKRGYVSLDGNFPPVIENESQEGSIPVLSYDDVEAIRVRFNELNPYDPELVQNILKYDQERRITHNYKAFGKLGLSEFDSPLYCYAISAKRYALFAVDGENNIRIIENKEHGLGLYLDPQSPDRESEKGKRKWATSVWEYLISLDAGRNPEDIYWFDRPAMTRVKVSTWDTLNAFRTWNDSKNWADRIKPYNFAISPVVSSDSPASFVMSPSEKPRLIGAFNVKHPEEWTTDPFWNIHDPSGLPYRISTTVSNAEQADEENCILRVDSYRDVIRKYLEHPEIKYADRNGKPCGKHTKGILYRREIHIDYLLHQGKESNHLSDDLQDNTGDPYVITEYGTGRTVHNDFTDLIIPVLKSIGNNQTVVNLLSQRGIQRTKQGIGKLIRTGTLPKDASFIKELTRIAVTKAIADIGESNLPNPLWRRIPIAMRYWKQVLIAWRNQNTK